MNLHQNSQIQNYISLKKELQDFILEFISNEDDTDQNFSNITRCINSQKITENHNEFKALLILISKISKNYYHYPSFFNKIEQILTKYENEIKQTFSNSEIFDIFDSNKRILLFLITRQIIKLDDLIYSKICQLETRFSNIKKYFYPELKDFLSESEKKDIEESLRIYENDEYIKKRLKGENEAYLAELIRNDSIEDFVSYSTRLNLSLIRTKLDQSLFETNRFLIDKEPTIIEYACFFGSLQIFKYLLLNNVELDSSLWIYAIHGKNPEIIHLLEENKIKPNDPTYKECIIESIKCHYNDIVSYFVDNFLIVRSIICSVAETSFRYYNYDTFTTNFNNFFIFYYLCRYGYFELVKIYLDSGVLDSKSDDIFIYSKIFVVSFLFFFYKIFIYIIY